MGSDDEKNLLIFRRDDAGSVTELIERRKFNDLQLTRRGESQRESPVVTARSQDAVDARDRGPPISTSPDAVSTRTST